MSHIFVSGLINLETTLAVEKFPLEYFPVRYPFFGIQDRISGVGFNVAKALNTLGDDVRLCSLTGRDFAGRLATETLEKLGLDASRVLATMEETPHSIILFEPSGRRQIHVDLKSIQETPYSPDLAAAALKGCDVAVLCNINFSRPLLPVARDLGIPIATDLHALSSLYDEYNSEFLKSAHIAFLSHEHLTDSPEMFVMHLFNTFPLLQIVVIGLGAEGALLGVRRTSLLKRFPAVNLRPIVNTIGAGDALFSAFVHFWARNHDPEEAMRAAIRFAAWKIGANGGAEGFLTEPELLAHLP